MMSYNDMMSVTSKLHNVLQKKQKHKVTVCGFLLHLLDFVSKNCYIDVVLDEDIMNKSSTILFRKYNSNFISANDMALYHPN